MNHRHKSADGEEWMHAFVHERITLRKLFLQRRQRCVAIDDNYVWPSIDNMAQRGFIHCNEIL